MKTEDFATLFIVTATMLTITAVSILQGVKTIISNYECHCTCQSGGNEDGT